ncbi:NAD-capped RNA hydrolase NUDT12-like [Branchiostoma lanceolatum]|uniref:NAD-capped RNA hydrolase NUDT12-like n=1 Tax=Branchiostoma lanceolatum TaxID=7740 RepID=UPI001132E438
MDADGLTPQKQFQEHFFTCASRGDVKTIEDVLQQGTVKIDATNDHGWTALMFAARTGQDKVVRLLLDHGCDTTVMNKSCQTAADIAAFWNHTAVLTELEKKGQTSDSQPQNFCNYFGYNPLDRYAHKRKDEQWLEEKLRDQSTVILLFHDLGLVVTKGEKLAAQSRVTQPCHFTFNDTSALFEELGTEKILLFLGLGRLQPDKTDGPSPPTSDKEEHLPAWFALDVTSISQEKILSIKEGLEIASSPFPGLFQLPEKEAGIVAQARSLLAWHQRYKFCPTCGSAAAVEEAGYKRRCQKEGCPSLKGVHNTSYPRTDPVVIMLIVSQDGKKCLLGRGKRFPGRMYSCLAGFMEPGETIEDAVRREVYEESGVRVGRVQYHSSQPFPLPASLMIGCLGYATSETISVDKEELEDAQWFTRQQVAEVQTGAPLPTDALTNPRAEGPSFFLPPAQAIAHQLVKAWLRMSPNL